MASLEGFESLDAKLGEEESWSMRSSVKQERDSRLSLEAQNVAREVKELSFGHGAAESLLASFASSTTSGSGASLNIAKNGSEAPKTSGQESLSCPLHNHVTGGVTGLSLHEEIAPEVSQVVPQLSMGMETKGDLPSFIQERGFVRDLEAVKETPLGLKGRLEQNKFSCEASERAVEKILQERNYSSPLGMATAPRKWNSGSFHRGLGNTEQGDELNFGEENVHSNDKLCCSVESAAEGSVPSIPCLSTGTDVGGGLMCNMHHKTPGKGHFLISKGNIVEESMKTLEGEPHSASKETTVENLIHSPPEKRNQSFEVALESCGGAEKCNCDPGPSGTALRRVVETTWGTSDSLGHVETSGRVVDMATAGAQLNPDLEAAFIVSSVNGRTVPAFLGALSREKVVETRRVLNESLEKTSRGKMRNHGDAKNGEREVISDFDMDTPLSCIFKPKRVPCNNTNVEASEASEHLRSSSGVSLFDLEVIASTSGLDGGAEEFSPFRVGSEALGTYVGFGVVTGARGVTPLTIGIATAGGVMEVLIPRSTTIPTKKVVVFSTFVDYQTEVQIQIYEGERVRTMDNKLLGTFEFSGIPAAPRGVARICVSFEIDARGILNVFVKDKSTGRRKPVAIVTTIGSLSKEMVEEMIEDGEKKKLEDETHKIRINAKRSLEAYAYQLRDWISDEEVCQNLDPNDKEKMDEAVESVINWLLYKSWLFHCYNQLDEATEFDKKHTELKSVCTPILESIYQRATTPRST